MSETNGHSDGNDLPDKDAIKLFVGQIPRAWDEKECTKFFEKYGRVYSLNVHRDRQTHISKGCCFVIYYKRVDAMNAVSSLHNIYTIEGMHNPVQMKPADVENRNERKLFIGMINKQMSDDDVRAMFARFGQIEESSVLRGEDGKSRGCAFVTFTQRSYAHTAMQEMHNSEVMEGCSKPIVVRFAHTQKDREARKLVSPQLVNSSPLVTVNQLTPNINTPVVLQALQPIPFNLLGVHALQQQIAQKIAAGLAAQGISLSALSNSSNVSAANSVVDILTNQNQASIPFQLSAMSANALTSSVLSGMSTTSSSDSRNAIHLINQLSNTSALNALQSNYLPPATYNLVNMQSIAPLILSGLAGNNGATALFSNQILNSGCSAVKTNANFAQLIPPNAVSQSASKCIPVISNTPGPDGANLFVYHLPPEYTEQDLIGLFSPYGKIVSVKVYIDPLTSLSKCFAFVSYDNALSAQTAIRTLNGLVVSQNKRLKVSLKRNEKPY